MGYFWSMTISPCSIPGSWRRSARSRTDQCELLSTPTRTSITTKTMRTSRMTTPDTIFVPGHAQLSRREDLIAVRDAIAIIHARFLEMVKKGMTLEQIREARPSKEFDARFATENLAPNEIQNSTRWYQQMFEEAKAHLAAH